MSLKGDNVWKEGSPRLNSNPQRTIRSKRPPKRCTNDEWPGPQIFPVKMIYIHSPASAHPQYLDKAKHKLPLLYILKYYPLLDSAHSSPCPHQYLRNNVDHPINQINQPHTPTIQHPTSHR
mmetsp:Transcript_10368/g.27014  ORF Transcript_10368/g.27014 Transcript_10368/m.27014 type:complete len:121 (+) Transcript_10368:56-418(+)|eukprot:1151850-Pelagomonas_calceolata.AAC.2